MTTLLPTITPLVGIIAREATASRPDLYDDARQEGLIAAWRATQRRPDAPREYLVAAARNGIHSALRGRPATGGTGHQGRRDAHDAASGFPEGYDAPARDGHLTAGEWAAHRHEIGAAIRELDPRDRDFVVLRFWGDLPGHEAAGRIGVPRGTAERRWAQVARPHLARRLAHLAPAA